MPVKSRDDVRNRTLFAIWVIKVLKTEETITNKSMTGILNFVI